MPKQEFGIQAGNTRFKFIESVNTANGVYMIFPIPEMQMHLSLHYPNEKHDAFGAFLRVPGLDLSYTLELDQDILTLNNLLKMVNSFNTVIDNGLNRTLDESDVIVLPDSLLGGFSMSGRKNYFDMSNLMFGNWRFTTANRLPELVTRTSPIIVGLSLEQKNTAILFDRDVGAFQLSLDDMTQCFNFNIFGKSFHSSLNDALEEIKIRRPDVLEQITPTDLVKEIQNMFRKAGANLM